MKLELFKGRRSLLPGKDDVKNYVEVSSTKEDFNHRAVEIILLHAERALRAAGRFRLCLAGGNTPRLVYDLFAQQLKTEYAQGRLAGTICFYWGDERCVSPQDPNSNFLMAQQTLFHQIPSSRYTYYRLEGELNPAIAAERYETLLRRHFPDDREPTFDLVLLGLGEDGHTASLFPGSAALAETQHWVVGYFVQSLSSWRLTLTPPLFNRAKAVLFLVTGSNKAATLAKVLAGSPKPHQYPAQSIHPGQGELFWLADQPAAALLPPALNG